MQHPDPISEKSVTNIMTTRRLVHELNSWLEDLHPSGTPRDPDRLYLIVQQTINESDKNATHKSLLENAKKNWNQAGPPSDNETMGNLFRNWLNQQDLDPLNNLALTHTIAVAFADVQRVLPGTNPAQQLQAIKGLWTAYHRTQSSAPLPQA